MSDLESETKELKVMARKLVEAVTNNPYADQTNNMIALTTLKEVDQQARDESRERIESLKRRVEELEQVFGVLDPIHSRLYCKQHPLRDEPGCSECEMVREFLAPFYRARLGPGREKEYPNQRTTQ